jgi:hypothetical protein
MIELGSWSICPTSQTFKPDWGTAEEHLALGIRMARAIGSKAFRVILGNQADRLTPGGIEARIADTVAVLKAARTRAIDAGVDGIYCSNHGGRQANGGLPAIDCLPDVVAAAGDVPVLFDSGVRSGADVVKALALGARAVGVGRPYAFGAALAGTEGIVHVLRSVLAEADLIMAIDGYPTLKDLNPAALRRVG